MRRRRARVALGPGALTLLLAPGGLLYLLVFVYPIGALLAQSVQVDGHLGLAQYARVFGQPLYMTILWRTLRISAVVTALCLALGFPVALWMTRLRGTALALAVMCVLLPLWSSVLARIYAWGVLLQRTGLINQVLVATGLSARPLTLLYTEGAVVVAMVHVLLPFMILPVYSVLRAIPPDLGRAARSLGAPAWREFFAVTVPLGLPGVAAGGVIVFVMALGYFIVPALLGGPQTLLISTLINQQITAMLNWPFGAAIAAVVLATAMVVILSFNKALAVTRRAESA